ncbi:MAG: hypothetical protein II309_07110 [Bacilli bacterium]|nr:hypothetical protein [Bacilli bacterium]
MRGFKTIYPNLLAELARNGYSYRAISKELDISFSAFSKKMKGLNEFTLSEAFEITDILKSDINYLFEKRK